MSKLGKHLDQQPPPDEERSPHVIRYPGNVVSLDDTRSQEGGAGRPNKCFYCTGKTGKQHDENCVCLYAIVWGIQQYDAVVSAAAPQEVKG